MTTSSVFPGSAADGGAPAAVAPPPVGVDPARLLEVVAHAAPLVIWALNAEGTCTLSVGGGLAAFGVTDGELVGRNVFEMFPDGPSRDAVARALAGESYRARVQLMNRDFITWYEPDWAPDGTLRGCTAVSVDVSAEHQREQLELERIRDRASVLHYLLVNDETDRRAVARELHDDVIQVVTGLGIRVDLLRQAAQEPTGQALAAELAEFDDAVAAMTGRLRALVGTLEPLDVAGADLGRAIGSLVRQAMGPLGVEGRVRIEADAVPSDVVARVLYRVLQEALTNVARHARATTVDVLVRHDPVPDQWVLLVRDDGIGAATGYDERVGHRGLRGMRERVELAGGRLEVGPDFPAGTVVRAELPGRLPGAEPAAFEGSGPTLGRVLSTVVDALAVVDHSWRLLYVNQRALQMLEVPDGALPPGADLWSLVGRDSTERGPARSMLERAMTEQQETTFEAPFGDLWLRVRAVPSREGLLLLARDLTAQRSMQRRLLEMESVGHAGRLPLDGAGAVVMALVDSRRFVRAQVVSDELGAVATAAGDAASADQIGEPVVLPMEGGRLEVTPVDTITAADEAMLDLAVRTLRVLRPVGGEAPPAEPT